MEGAAGRGAKVGSWRGSSRCNREGISSFAYDVVNISSHDVTDCVPEVQCHFFLQGILYPPLYPDEE